MNAIILTPISPFAEIPPLKLSFPRVFSELEPFSDIREVNINANREKLQRGFLKEARYAKYDFVILMDSDVVVDQQSIDKLFDEWKENTTPCINTKGTEEGGVVTSCALISRDDYFKVRYMEKPYQCQCAKLPNPFYVKGVSGYEIDNDVRFDYRKMMSKKLHS